MKQRNFNQRAKRQKGVTLIELLLGIAVVLVVVGVGIVIYNQVSGSSRAYAASNGLMNLAASVKSMHPRPDFSGLGTDGTTGSGILVNSGKAPSNMVVSGSLVGQFGGQVGILSSSYAGGTNNAYAIIYPNVPRAECNDLINSAENNFQVIAVGTSTGPSNFTAGTNGTVKDLGAATPVRPTAASISTACNNETNAIRFIGT